MTSFNPCQGY